MWTRGCLTTQATSWLTNLGSSSPETAHSVIATGFPFHCLPS